MKKNGYKIFLYLIHGINDIFEFTESCQKKTLKGAKKKKYYRDYVMNTHENLECHSSVICVKMNEFDLFLKIRNIVLKFYENLFRIEVLIIILQSITSMYWKFNFFWLSFVNKQFFQNLPILEDDLQFQTKAVSQKYLLKWSTIWWWKHFTFNWLVSFLLQKSNISRSVMFVACFTIALSVLGRMVHSMKHQKILDISGMTLIVHNILFVGAFIYWVTPKFKDEKGNVQYSFRNCFHVGRYTGLRQSRHLRIYLLS